MPGEFAAEAYPRGRRPEVRYMSDPTTPHDGPPPSTGSDDRNSILRRFALWAAGAVGVAFLGGVGAWLYTHVEDEVEVRTTPPVEINVDVEPDPSFWQDKRPDWYAHFYYVPAGKELTPPPRDCRERRDWAWSLNGADADQSRIALTVTGNRSGEVSFRGMSVEVVERRGLEDGVVAACPVGGAEGEVYGLIVDLDRKTVRFNDPAGKGPARIVLENGKTETFEIVTRIPRKPQLIEWRLSLDVVFKERRTPVIVDDGGEPFRTAGAAEAETPMVVWRQGRWVSLR
jgi:hypothetical protein